MPKREITHANVQSCLYNENREYHFRTTTTTVSLMLTNSKTVLLVNEHNTTTKSIFLTHNILSGTFIKIPKTNCFPEKENFKIFNKKMIGRKKMVRHLWLD